MQNINVNADEYKIFRAIVDLYPMAAVVDITNNTFSDFQRKGFVNKGIDSEGTYDHFIECGASETPKGEQRDNFLATFNAQNVIHRAKDGKKSVELEHEHILEDGRVHWMRSQIVFWDNEENSVKGLFLAEVIDDEILSRRESLKAAAMVNAVARDCEAVVTVNFEDETFSVQTSSESIRSKTDKLKGTDANLNDLFDVYIHNFVFEDDIDYVMRECSVRRIYEKLSEDKEYRIYYRGFSTHAPRYFELRCLKLEENNSKPVTAALCFLCNDTEIRERIAAKFLGGENEAIYMANLSHDMLFVLRKSSLTNTDAGEGIRYSKVIGNLANHVENKDKEFFEQLSKPKYMIEFLKDSDRREVMYKLPMATNQWRRMLVQVVNRKDGQANDILISFMGIDEYAARHKELKELQQRENAMVSGLSADFESVFFIEPYKDLVTTVRRASSIAGLDVDIPDKFTCEHFVNAFCNIGVSPETGELIRNTVSKEALISKFSDDDSKIHDVLNINVAKGEKDYYYQIKLIKVIDENANGRRDRLGVIIGVQDADDIVRSQMDYEKGLENRVREQDESITDYLLQINMMQDNIIESMATLVESRDINTGDHVQSTRKYVQLLVEKLRNDNVFPALVSERYVEGIVLASVLHDVGKIFVSDMILNKPGKLTPEEFDIIKTHTSLGKEIVEEIFAENMDKDMADIVYDVVYSHHEKWNGTGYPQGLKGEEIPLPARIMAVADVFDALVSRRSYKEPFSIDRALQILDEDAGTHFDRKVVDAMLAIRPELEEYLATRSEADNQTTLSGAVNSMVEAMQVKSLTSAFVEDYVLAALANTEDGGLTVFRIGEELRIGEFNQSTKLTLDSIWERMNKYIHPEDAAEFERIFSCDGLKSVLDDKDTYFYNFRIDDKGEYRHFQINLIKIVYASNSNVNKFDVLIGIRDIEESEKIREKEHELKAKKDLDSFKNALDAKFLGAYIVNLKTDEVRSIYRPKFFEKMLAENGNKFSRAMRVFVDVNVQKDSKEEVLSCLDYSKLGKMIEWNKEIRLKFAKNDHSSTLLTITKTESYSPENPEVLWIFEKADGKRKFSSIFSGFADTSQEKDRLSELKDNLLDGLSREYESIWLLDGRTHDIKVYQSSDDVRTGPDSRFRLDYKNYDTGIIQYIIKNVAPDDRDMVYEAAAFGNVEAKTPDNGVYSVTYKSVDKDGYIAYNQMCFAKAVNSSGQTDFIFAFRDVDEMVRSEIMKDQKIRSLEGEKFNRNVITSLSDDYEAVFFVDLDSDMGKIIRLEERFGSLYPEIGEDFPYEQSVEAVISKEYVENSKELKEFLQVENIKSVLNNNVTAYYNYRRSICGETMYYQLKFIRTPQWKDKKTFLLGVHDFDDLVRRDIERVKNEQMARDDALTGLLNKLGFEEEVSKYIRQNGSMDTALACLDLDFFKMVNDTLGTVEGDKILIATSDELKKVLSDKHLAARLGGDAFTIFFKEADKEDVENVLRMVRERIHEKFFNQYEEIDVTASIGCIISRVENQDLNSLRIQADRELYKSKIAGRGELSIRELQTNSVFSDKE